MVIFCGGEEDGPRADTFVDSRSGVLKLYNSGDNKYLVKWTRDDDHSTVIVQLVGGGSCNWYMVLNVSEAEDPMYTLNGTNATLDECRDAVRALGTYLYTGADVDDNGDTTDGAPQKRAKCEDVVDGAARTQQERDEREDVAPVPAVAQQHQQEEEEEEACVVCLDTAPQTTVFPCAHHVCCHRCSDALAANAQQASHCVVCRQQIDAVADEVRGDLRVLAAAALAV